MAVFLGILLLATIILPLVIQLLQTESKQTVAHQKSTVAFQLAEAAVAKGVAKLTETRKNFTDASAGIALTRFNDDYEFTDINGGRYKVLITSGSLPGTVRIIGKGLDSSSKEMRAIEAEYTGIDPRAPALIFGKGLSPVCPNIFCHWGSILGYDRLDYHGSETYPRIYCRSAIYWRDENPAPPNTNDIDYWAYQSDMGSPPVPDLAYYKQKALNSVVPSSTTTGEIRYIDGSPLPARTPPNSGYFPPSLWTKHIVMGKKLALPEGMGNMYELRSSTTVIYINNTSIVPFTTSIQQVFLDVEAIIAEPDDIEFSGSTVTYQIYGATIPDVAPYQYQGSKLGQYSYPSAQTVWANKFAATFAQQNHCCYIIPNANENFNIQVHGYVYTTGILFTRGLIVNGVVQVDGPGGGSFSGGSYVFYDPNVLKNVVWSRAPIFRLSWKESSRSW